MNTSGFYIIDLPVPHDRTKYSKGNGGEARERSGTPHKITNWKPEFIIR